MMRKGSRFLLGMALLSALAGGGWPRQQILAASPQVLKVEPPNWWTGHSWNPVRLLIRGRGLQGARVSASQPGVEVGLTRVNAAGSYLFVDLRIGARARPGPHDLAIRTSGGTVTAPFRIDAPLPRRGRFQGLSQDDVIYLLMPDRFSNGDTSNDDPPKAPGLHDRSKARYYHGGDLQGVIDRLPYLAGLGVTALWMNPVYDNVDHLNRKEIYDGQPITDYHGYGAVDFYAVDEHLGDVQLFRRLVDEAHRHGIKVIQDQVANHSGPYHPWVTDSPTPGWYNGTVQDHLANSWQVWTLADPHAGYQIRKATLEGWFIDILPDLNQNDQEAAGYIIQNSLWWVGVSGLDAIRQDTLPYVPRSFWRDWMKALKAEYPELEVIGELFDGNPMLVSFFQGGQARFDGIDSGIDTLFDFPLHFALKSVFTRPGSSMRDIARVFSHDHLYSDPSMLVTFLDLHDTPRFISEPGADLEGLKLACTLLFTARGIPLIYYGTEVALPGGADPDNRRDFPGGWPSDPHNAFEESGRTPARQKFFAQLRRLIQLRRHHEALRRGRMVHLLTEDRSYAFARVGEHGSVIAVFNKDEKEEELEFGVAGIHLEDGARLQDMIGGRPPVEIRHGRFRVRLPARSAAVYMRQHD